MTSIRTTTDTVYVGTGEANICGSGCVAGTGLYRSTNGGRSWKLLGKTEFQGKGIGEIVVHPTNRTPLRRLDDRASRHVARSAAPASRGRFRGSRSGACTSRTDGGETWSFIHNGSADDGRAARAT